MTAGPTSAVLALDIGGTKLAAGVVTEDGRTHGLLVEPTRKTEGPEVVISRLFEMGHRAIALGGGREVVALGISCGGPLDSALGVIERPLNLPGWINIPIVELAEREFGLPSVLENDASAAALGEYRYGAAQNRDTVVYLTISTGIGGGMLFNGRLHRGAAGNGGEPGHIRVREGGRLCLCGRIGCLEAYASGTSIAARANEALQDAVDSSLASLDTVTSEDVFAAACTGDALATDLWRETTDVLSVAIIDLINVIEPNIVVLGGGVTRAGDALLNPIRTQVRQGAKLSSGAVADIALAGLGDSVSLVGAGAVAFDHIKALQERSA